MSTELIANHSVRKFLKIKFSSLADFMDELNILAHNNDEISYTMNRKSSDEEWTLSLKENYFNEMPRIIYQYKFKTFKELEDILKMRSKEIDSVIEQNTLLSTIKGE